MKHSCLGVFVGVLVSFSFSNLAYSQSCPIPHAKYWELLSRLDRFTQGIKKAPECQSIVEQLSSLKVFYSQSDRKLVDRALKVSDGKEELSIDELKQLSTYSQEVTTKVGALVASLTDQPGCLEKKNSSSLSALASITQEVSSLSASFSGPYGMIIQTGGAVISGILRGIDAIVQSFKDPYDFSKSDDRMLFITNLCTYDSIREEVLNLSNPENLITTYQELITQLGIKKEKLLQFHPAAKTYDEIYRLRKEAADVETAFHAQFRKLQQANSVDDPWTQCIELARFFHPRETSPAEALVKVLDSPALEISGIDPQYAARGYLDAAYAPDGVMTAASCLSERSNKNLQKRNRWSHALVKQIGISYQQNFEVAISRLAAEGEKEMPVYGYNSVVWLQSTYLKLDWASSELPGLRQLAAPASFSARRELVDRKEYLDHRLYVQLAPRFMQWYMDDTERSLASFGKSSERTLGDLKKQYLGDLKARDAREMEWAEFLKRMESNVNRSAHSHVFFSLETIMNDLMKAAFSVMTTHAYCTYLTSHGSMTGKLAGACTGKFYQDYMEQVKKLQTLSDAIGAYAEWCYQNNHVDRTSLEQLLAKIRKCHEDIGVPLRDGEVGPRTP